MAAGLDPHTAIDSLKALICPCAKGRHVVSKPPQHEWLVAEDSVGDDRGVWEPPLFTGINGTFSLNVTALAQQAAAESSNLSLIIAATGDAYECQLSESIATVARPVLTVVSTSTATTSGGTITPDMPANGTALVNHAPILQADVTPMLSLIHI